MRDAEKDLSSSGWVEADVGWLGWVLILKLILELILESMVMEGYISGAMQVE